MQLTSILQSLGELLQGSVQSPDMEDADAVLPFAAVLSGAFALVTPDGQTDEATKGAGSEDALEGAIASVLVPHAEPAAEVEKAAGGVSSRQDGGAESSISRPVGEVQIEAAATGEVSLEGADGSEAETDTDVQQHPARVSSDVAASKPDTEALDKAVEQAVRGEVRAPAIEPGDETVSLDTVSLDQVSEEEPAVDDEAPSPASHRRTSAAIQPNKNERVRSGVTVRNAAPRTEHLKRETGVTPSVLIDETTLVEDTGTQAAVLLGDRELPTLDGEGLVPEKTTSSSTEDAEQTTLSGEKGTLTDAEGEAAGQEGSKQREGSGDAQARRREHRTAVTEKRTPPPSVDAARQPEQKGVPDIASPRPPLEEVALADAPVHDFSPDSLLVEEAVAPRMFEQTASDASVGRTARRPLFQSRAMPAAWLRAVLNNARQTGLAEDGWKVLEMNLDEGDGTVTIKARREEGRVAVAVGFSDPTLRALASSNADRLQEVLQAEYETVVDFSLFSNDSGFSREQHQAEGASIQIGPGVGSSNSEGASDEQAPRHRSLPAGVHHEWVG